ncbi:BREX-3 system P-loop-containing protein BrxF [Risungbinella massiliensis]|uniref:BREX-3 system P-loop-containing protein BrxF n=1 Tax=Risungbinella massiliensis TaxID=1329796 RepID=UPI0005CB9250|nr:BREX-3 system P-loop-containing protein BrxF [Risungbinella massiliensis]
MIKVLVEQLEENLEEVKQYREQLIFLAGNYVKYDFQALSRDLNINYINVDLEFSRMLLEISQKVRARKAPSIFKDLFLDTNDSIFLLDHIEILFEASLQLDPGKLLEDISREYILIVPWYGNETDSYLIHAELGHPEYFKYLKSEVIVNSC